MERLTIRVDDVSPNTNLYDLNQAARFLKDSLDARIIYCVNLFSRSTNGSVYPDLPMRGRGLEYFVNVDKLFEDGFTDKIPDYVSVASHGLIHAEHAKLPEVAQYMSIMLSCNYLGTKTFVPPFMSYNYDTKKICDENGIDMIDGIGWKSMETEPFSTTNKLWYFHHWRMNSAQIKEWLSASKVAI